MRMRSLFTKDKEYRPPNKIERILCRRRSEMESGQMKMIFDCKECEAGGSIRDRRCRREVLTALAGEIEIDVIILSGYVERKHHGVAMDLLRSHANVLRELERFSFRDPMQYHFSALTSHERSVQSLLCKGCRKNPESMFRALREALFSDTARFFEKYGRCAAMLGNDRSPVKCRECIETSKGDIIYLFMMLSQIRSFVLFNAFRIVEA